MDMQYPSSLQEMMALFKGDKAVSVVHYEKFANEQVPRIVRIMPGAILKLGASELDEEALSAQYALEKLTIPVPRILRSPHRLLFRDRSEFNRSGLYPVYYAMEEVRGVSLDKVVDTLSMEEKRSIACQLRRILDQMSTLTSTTLGSVSGGPYRTLMAVPEWLHPNRPFSTVTEFRDYLYDLLVKCDIPSVHVEKIMSTIPSDSSIQFTHGDLLPKNIMVDGSTITGIIDWANSGFYPAFWEHARMHDPNWISQGWADILGMVFPGERLFDEGFAVSYMLSTFGRIL